MGGDVRHAEGALTAFSHFSADFLPMNPIIEQHVNEIELRLIESPIVISYEVLRREIAPTDGVFTIPTFFHIFNLIETYFS